MFGFGKKALIKRMSEYVNAVKVAVYAKLCADLSDKLLAAAATNHLFGDALSHQHEHLPEPEVEDAATGLLRDDDDDLRLAVVMSLQTLMTLRTDAGDTAAMTRIMERVQWVKEIVPLPRGAPNPETMAVLAESLQARYLTRGMAG